MVNWYIDYIQAPVTSAQTSHYFDCVPDAAIMHNIMHAYFSTILTYLHTHITHINFTHQFIKLSRCSYPHHARTSQMFNKNSAGFSYRIISNIGAVPIQAPPRVYPIFPVPIEGAPGHWN